MKRFSNLNIKAFCITAMITVMAFVTLTVTLCSKVAAEIFFDSGTYTSELKARIDKAAPGIVGIVAYDDTGTESGSGSGFFVDNGGLILTNAYILKNAYSAEVFTGTRRYTDVAIIREEEHFDLALIKIDSSNDTALEIDFEYDYEPGKKLTVIGRSQNMKITASEGSTQVINPVSETLKLIMVQSLPAMSFQPADSGPAIDPENKVIGISTTRTLENKLFGPNAINTDTLLRIISTDTIKAFLSGTSESKQLKAAGSRDLFKWTQKQAMIIFMFLYAMGFLKTLAIITAVLFFIAFLQWCFYTIRSRAK